MERVEIDSDIDMLVKVSNKEMNPPRLLLNVVGNISCPIGLPVILLMREPNQGA